MKRGHFEFVHERFTVILMAAFVLGGTGLLWGIDRFSGQVMEAMALGGAKVLSAALAEVRTLYTAEVVARAQMKGVVATHDYKDHVGAIPLPTIFATELGKRIGYTGDGAEVRLYSAYPFPWRKDGGARDEFERDALNALTRDPTKPFSRFEIFRGDRVLRYATADVLRPSCVTCHNTHPESPKRDWRVGEVRGVLEIIQPLEGVRATARRSLRDLIVVVGLVMAVASLMVGLTVAQLRRRSVTLAAISYRDGLTGLLNRRSLDEDLRTEWNRAERAGTPLALLIADIDYFKVFNDKFGHLPGDECLKKVANALSEARRSGDLVARYGGEEFVVVLPSTNERDAIKVAETLRARVESLKIPHHQASAGRPHVTVSIGVAAKIPSKGSDPTSLLYAADEALYRAKDEGRNAVRSAAAASLTAVD